MGLLGPTATGAALAEIEAGLALHGHSGDPALARSLMADHLNRRFVLARVPLGALDFQYDPSGRFFTDPDYTSAGTERSARTAAYAQLPTPAPPIRARRLAVEAKRAAGTLQRWEAQSEPREIHAIQSVMSRLGVRT